MASQLLATAASHAQYMSPPTGLTTLTLAEAVRKGDCLVVILWPSGAVRVDGVGSPDIDVSDSRGNTYQELPQTDALTIKRAYVWLVAPLETALEVGDTITLDWASYGGSPPADAPEFALAYSVRGLYDRSIALIVGHTETQAVGTSATVSLTHRDYYFTLMAVLVGGDKTATSYSSGPVGLPDYALLDTLSAGAAPDTARVYTAWRRADDYSGTPSWTVDVSGSTTIFTLGIEITEDPYVSTSAPYSPLHQTALTAWTYNGILRVVGNTTLETEGCHSVTVLYHADGSARLVFIEDGNAVHRESSDDGRTWSVSTTIATGYEACAAALDERLGLLVVPLYKESEQKWYLTVGTLNAAGDTWTFSTPALLNSSTRERGATLLRRADGVWEFTSVSTAGVISTLRCRSLASDGTGTWS